MKRDLRLFIGDILEAMQNIELFSKRLTQESLLNDLLRQSAIIRQIEIIGEAVKNIPKTFREKYPDVPWAEMAGMRDRIVHAYFSVDLDAVWNVIEKDLPVLKEKIRKIKKDMENTR